MHEETRPLSHIADAERDIKAARTFDAFREKVKQEGWMINTDGEVLCSEHAQAYKDKLAKLEVEAELSPLAEDEDVAKAQSKTRDNWFVMCSHEGCRNEVSEPFG